MTERYFLLSHVFPAGARCYDNAGGCRVVALAVPGAVFKLFANPG